MSKLQSLTPDQLVTATGGGFKEASFGALALLNASNMVTTPSSSVAKALQGPAPIVQTLTQQQLPRPAFIGKP